ncbi:class I SAM-dependent methyltransferase [Patescibacteria group bacterium]|nr:class I SAM-dependent methyltransferase [Patescibacteria group bacterium]
MEEKHSQQIALNLEILEKADNFTNWLYEEIKPFLKGNIFEVGSGHGTYSRKIIKDFPDSKIVLSDIEKNCINELEKIKKSNVAVLQIDISRQEDFKKVDMPINSVFALNVLEHIEDDVQTMNNVYDALSPGGTFIILVPAHKFLFNCIDKSVGHYRRYVKKDISEKVFQTKFKIKTMFYFNFLSIFGWYLNGNILKKNVINGSAVGLLNKLVPCLRFFERYILRKNIGISLIVVLEK